MAIVWTEEIDKFMVDLLAEDEEISYKEVAKEMSATFGLEFSKNSCIGRARKLGVPPRPPKVIVLPSIIMAAPPKPRKQGEPITILELREGVCRWPLAKVEDCPPYFYCGKPTVDLGCSWCQTHANIAFGRVTSGNAKIARPQW
jgi:hypothetical protein